MNFGGTASAMQQVKANRALVRGRNNLFERKGPKINFQPEPESAKTSFQTRQKFRKQLLQEQASDRRNSLYGIVLGLLFFLLVLVYYESILQFMVWITEGF